MRTRLMELSGAERFHIGAETFDAARLAGTLNRVDEIIREVRAGHPYA